MFRTLIIVLVGMMSSGKTFLQRFHEICHFLIKLAISYLTRNMYRWIRLPFLSETSLRCEIILKNIKNL
jgi:hypothetical protein